MTMIACAVSITIYLLYELLRVWMLHRSLLRPVRSRVRRICKKPGLFDAPGVKLNYLFYAYDQLPAHKLKIAQGTVRLREGDRGVLQTCIDYLIKLVFTVIVSFFTVLVMMMDGLPWELTTDSSGRLELYGQLLSFSELLYGFAFIAFGVIVIHSIYSTYRYRSIVQVHRLAIDSVRESRERGQPPLPARHTLLEADADFDQLRLLGLSVSVWENGEPIQTKGKIERHTDEAVYVNGQRFPKADFRFRVE